MVRKRSVTLVVWLEQYTFIHTHHPCHKEPLNVEYHPELSGQVAGGTQEAQVLDKIVSLSQRSSHMSQLWWWWRWLSTITTPSKKCPNADLVLSLGCGAPGDPRRVRVSGMLGVPPGEHQGRPRFVQNLEIFKTLQGHFYSQLHLQKPWMVHRSHGLDFYLVSLGEGF